MAVGRHFENGFIAISQPEIIRFQWNLVRRRRLIFQGRYLTKYQNFANSIWRTADILKIVFGYISTTDYRINAKFCTIKQNHVITQVTWPKCQISKIQDGGRPPFWKWFYRYISAGDHSISMQNTKILQIQYGGRSNDLHTVSETLSRF